MRSSCRIAAGALAALCAAALSACGGDHEYEPPDREALVAEAAAEFSPAVYDTLTWSGDSARLAVGNELYAAECRKCHGYLGSGETDYARQRDLEVPSLVEPGWRLADSLQAVRRNVYAGHAEGMPSWGVGRLTIRQIDAVAYYVLEELRPDALEAKEQSDEE